MSKLSGLAHRITDRMPEDTRIRIGVAVAGTATLGSAFLGVGIGPADDAADELPHVPPSSAPDLGVGIVEGLSLESPLTIRLPPAEPEVEVVAVGALRVAIDPEDAPVGRAAIAARLVEALSAPEGADAPKVERRERALTTWFGAAGIDTSEEIRLDIAALEQLAETLRADGTVPNRAGLNAFARARGLATPADPSNPRFAVRVAEAVGGAPEVLLDVVGAPSDAAVAGRHILARLGTDGARALLSSWNVAVPAGADVIVTASQAEAIHALAEARGVPADADPTTIAAKLQPVGARPDGVNARYDWYQRVVESQGHGFRTGAGEMNVIGLRAFDPVHGLNDNAFGQWNDTIAFVWTDGDGQRRVEELRATTDPGLASHWDTPDANGDGAGDVAHLRPGQYTYYAGTHRGRAGAGNPTVNVPVDRDTNHDGNISSEERRASIERGDVGYGINIHWSAGTDAGPVGSWSLGCQVVTLDYGQFLNQVAPHLRANPQVPYTLVEMPTVVGVDQMIAASLA